MEPDLLPSRSEPLLSLPGDRGSDARAVLIHPRRRHRDSVPRGPGAGAPRAGHVS